MRVKNNFLLREVVGEKILIAYCGGSADFTKALSLNDSAAYLWQQLQGREFKVDDAVKVMLDAFEVEEAEARQDVEELFASWKAVGCIED